MSSYGSNNAFNTLCNGVRFVNNSAHHDGGVHRLIGRKPNNTFRTEVRDTEYYGNRANGEGGVQCMDSYDITNIFFTYVQGELGRTLSKFSFLNE